MALADVRSVKRKGPSRHARDGEGRGAWRLSLPSMTCPQALGAVSTDVVDASSTQPLLHDIADVGGVEPLIRGLPPTV